MNAVCGLAGQAAADACKQLSNQIAWFYARREYGTTLSLTAYAKSLLTPRSAAHFRLPQVGRSAWQEMVHASAGTCWKRSYRIR